MNILFIFIFSFLTRALLLFWMQYVNPGGYLDALVRVDEARYIASAYQLTALLRNNILWDVPLYPFFLKIFFSLFGPSVHVAIWLNIGLFSIFVCLVYLVSKCLFEQKAAVCSAILIIFHPTWLLFGFRPVPEPLSACLLLLAFYIMLQYFQRSYVRYVLAISISLALLALTKESFLISPVIASFLFIFLRRIALKQALIHVLYCCIGYMLMLSPLCLFNYATHNRFTLSQKTTVSVEDRLGLPDVREGENTATQLLFGAVERQRAIINSSIRYGPYWDVKKRMFIGTGVMQLMMAFGYDSAPLRPYVNKPILFLREILHFSWPWILYQYFATIYLVIVYLSSFLAMLLLVKAGRLKEIISFLLFIFIFLYVYINFFVPRYFLLFAPFLIMLSSYGVVTICSSIKCRKVR
ncbi:MAG: glycosyltransferase family 39 protein [Candidatus Omnitrophica bacterium]|nr:glycosyltransferase family 39 protein [Candidatus Omnitrophota bacterium]